MYIKRNYIRICCIFLAFLFIFISVFSAFAFNSGFVSLAEEEKINYSSTNNEEYANYLNKYSSYNKNVDDIDIDVQKASFVDTSANVINFEKFGNVIKWNDGQGEINFSFASSVDALYSVKVFYRPTDENVAETLLGIKLDGSYPFEALNDISFPTFWKDESNKFSKDYFGNELTPKQVISDGFFERYAQDKSGLITDPYSIFIPKGQHTLTLVGKDSGVLISKMVLSASENIASYSKSINSSEVKPFKADTIKIQGEHPTKKSSRSLLPMADTLDSRVSPSDYKYSLLNYVGGVSWQYTGDTLEYSFKVSHSGYYKLGFMYKQSANMNRNSYRKLAIDGIVPFKEAKSIPYKYSTSWEFESFSSDSGKDYLIWLEKGKHTLSLEVTLGEKEADFCRRMSAIAEDLNSLYLEIIKITGASPDLNRDYELFKQIPDFDKILDKNVGALKKLISDMEKESGSSEIAASLKNMKQVLEKMITRPYRAHDYVSSYYSAYSQVSSWLFDMKKMPLSLDEIQIVPNNKDFDIDKSNFFSNAGYRLGRFVCSFVNDYNSVSGGKERKDNLLIWVTWGKDQASALDIMIKNDFTPKTGIKVNLKIVGASLVNGLISGKFPDLILNVSRTEPVNLGMRDALYNLKNFDDYEEVLKRFQKGAEVPYIYNNECYALPDTQQFFVMIYRKDILSNLNVSVPKTWEEFRNVAALVQRNNMEVYIPYTQITTNTSVVQGIGSMNLFPTLLKQSGLSLYSKDKRKTALTDNEVIDVFENWTEMYTDYQFVKESDFYNRFRMGIMPIGIVPYSTYFMIKEMAPEVQGKWSVALVPGNDGNNVITAGGSGCSVVKRSNKKESAWEFLKWWTSADTQFEYSNRVESILGLVGRIPTSNIEAFKRMDWDREHLNTLLEQWSNVEELEEIPGSYYMIRSIDQAYWSVINNEMNAKDALSYWSGSADDEIRRKYREYGN